MRFMSSGTRRHLGDVAEITAGPSGSLLERLSDGPGGVPVISPSDITSHHTVDTRKLRRVPVPDAQKLARFALREGDVLVVRQGSLGRLALIGADCASWLYSSSCLRIRARRELLQPEYLVSVLSYPPTLDELLDQALPGTVPSINSEALNNLRIALPSIEQQRGISEITSDLEAQICVHTEIVERLEALKPAIFRDLIEKAQQHEQS
jgi:type I restriction enzyme S subunit